MESGLYVAVSGQIAAQRRLDTIAHNIANVNTPGFRAEEIKFESLISDAGKDPVAFSSSGETFFSRKSGSMVQTGNPLDIAVSGNAWLAVETPAGMAYTRDGRLQVSQEGQLRSINGYPIVDVSGAPIQVGPKEGPITISADGMISQKGVRVGAVGLFRLEEQAKLARYDNSALLSEIPGQPVVNFNEVSVQQGFLEESNVNAMMEMTNLITLTRNFEAVSSATDQFQDSLKEAIRKLGTNG